MERAVKMINIMAATSIPNILADIIFVGDICAIDFPWVTLVVREKIKPMARLVSTKIPRKVFENFRNITF